MRSHRDEVRIRCYGVLGPCCSPHLCHTNAASPTLPRCPFPLSLQGTGEILGAKTLGNTKPCLCLLWEHPQWDVFCFVGPAEPMAGRKEELEARPCCPLTFDDSDVLYLIASVVVSGPQLAHVDPLIAGGEAVQVEAHQVLVHGDVSSVPVDILSNVDGALDDVLPVVLGEAEFVGQGVAGLVLIAAVHTQALAQQAGAQVPDHLAVRSLQHWDRQAERGNVSTGDTRAAPQVRPCRALPVRMTAMLTVGFIFPKMSCPEVAASER